MYTMMKKIFSLTWILAMTTSLFAQEIVFTYKFDEDDETGGGVIITGTTIKTDLGGEVEIPESIIIDEIEFSVNAIGDSAFKDYTKVTKFNLPSTLKKIGNFAFENCKQLTSITIPATVTVVGVNPFKSCIGINEFLVEEGNTRYVSIDGVLFSTSEGEFTVNGNLISYPCNKKDQRYDIPEGVIKVGQYALMDNPNLYEIHFPNQTRSIGNFAFTGCTSLKKLYLGDDINLISSPLFLEYETGSIYIAVEEVHFSNPNAAPYMIGVFDDMPDVKLYIPLGSHTTYENSLVEVSSNRGPEPTGWGQNVIRKKTVEEGYADEDGNETPLLYNSIRNNETYELIEGEVQVVADRNNPYSGNIQVPEQISVKGVTYTVTRIGEEAFTYNETNSIYLPATINDIDESGLTRIPDLEAIYLDSDNPYFMMKDGVLYNSDQTSLLLIPSGLWFDGGTYTTPATVKTIGFGAIYMTKYLTNFTTGAEIIEGENFTLCEGLKEVYLTSENLQRFMMSMLTEGATFFFSTNTTPQTESWANYGDCTFVVNEDFYETNKYESPWTSAYRLATRAESASFDDNLLDLDRHDLYVENLSITLNFTHNGPRSACYSFPIPVNILRENGIEVYDLYRPDYYEAVGDGYALKFKQLWSGETPVDDPLILECAEGKTVTISIPNTILPKENSTEQSIGETVEDYDNWDKYPHFTMTMVENGDLTFPTNTADLAGYSEVWALGGGKLGHISATATVLPHRWYVTLPTAAGTSAAKLRLSLDSADDASTTDLNVITEKTTAPALPIYNLNGMRAVSGRLTPGLYVQGGKIFRCEGAKM